MNFRKALPLLILALASFLPDAGAINTARHSHTSTLLPDGNILITGGSTNTVTATNSVEMYDMASNTYVNWTGGLKTARSSHTATLMSDGRVLIAGGFDSTGQPLSSLEICDPRSTVRTCSAAGVSMTTARGGHTATLLSRGLKAGQVLLCGGQSGAANTTITETCDTFNPSGPAVLPTGAMVSPREGHAALLLHSGRVFVTGGRLRNLADTAWIYEMQNEMYDPSTEVWTPVAALLQGRVNHTATVLNNGKIMIAGGYNETNRKTCRGDADSLEGECWHIINDPLDAIQNAGNHGYLDGAEFFDQNGARVILQEGTYGEMPYRVAQNSAVLEPDGKLRMYGGYGNIYPTFFTGRPVLTADSVIRLTQIAGSTHTAAVVATSLVKFPLDFTLSRPVSGRLVDADAFISGPANPELPSLNIATANFYLQKGSAPADGFPVGMLLGEKYKPGDFNHIVQLTGPSGTAVFSKSLITSGESPYTTTVGNSTLGVTDTVFPGKSGHITGTVTAQVRLTVPDTYRSIVGVANVLGGQIIDDDTDEEYSVSLEESGSGNFDTGAATPVCDTEAKTCVFAMNMDFPLYGHISNLTSNSDPLRGGTTFYVADNPLSITGDKIKLSLELDYIAREVSVLDREPIYTFDTSTMVVRGMVFSTQLSYAPKSNTWGDLTNTDESPALATPSFNHTALLTPAADTVILGGRNCEYNPDADCLRGTPRFSTATTTTIFIPVYRNPDGEVRWPVGEPLNSKRAFHTSTLLPDGRILTCGGSDGVSPLATCELMDPATKKWAATGSMNSPRANHTATLLPNGNVLAAGGITPSGIAVTSAEIYYPDAQRWVPTSSMANARQLHTATLMPDGNVLVTGGATLSTYSATTEIYISSNASWINSGSMAYGRAQHTATLLKNGNILVAGGVNGLGTVSKSEVFGYTSRAFISALATDLNSARYAHTANQLRDGSVIVIGGTDGKNSMTSCEIYNGITWAEPLNARLNNARANHRSVLLPNGKIMVTGGELSGTVQYVPESFDPDYRSWSTQGQASGRTHHTSVLTADNLLVNIGGWSGGNYLNSTEYANFFYPDTDGLAAETARQPVVSACKEDLFNQGSTVTLLSGTTNFHGITEASGGGAGPANSSYHNPRVYIQQIDNPSGFMLDLSTRIYSLYGGTNGSWEKTLSSITVIMPASAGELPHGWYHMRVAADGQFSAGHIVQVTVPRPSGVTSVPAGEVLDSTSVRWTWNQNTLKSLENDGYAIFSSTDSVFLTTTAFAASAAYNQTALTPNAMASIKIAGYNTGGYSAFQKSTTTVYTLAVAPQNLTVDAASFETATLSWNPMGNSPLTIYEVSMSTKRDFSPVEDVFIPKSFNDTLTSTSTTITQLKPNQIYYSRVRARNMAGNLTSYDDAYMTGAPVSTVTVGNITNLSGTPLTMSSINWSWDPSAGADSYEAYDFTAATTSVLFASTILSNLTQINLSTNTAHKIAVNAVKNTSAGPVRGPIAVSASVYTLAVQPLPGVPSAFTNITTGTITLNWIHDGNPASTRYRVIASTDINFAALISTKDVTGISAVLSDLSPNTSYYAKIIAMNGDGRSTEDLILGYEYTKAQAPANFRPTNISMSGISLAWDIGENPASTFYEVRGTTTPDCLNTQSCLITTYVPFSQLYTTNTVSLNGLLTATTYYFDVAAMNGAELVTARMQSVPAVRTLPGPDGAPRGSIGGTSQPGVDVTIEGTLPNGRNVSLIVPAGSFESQTEIAISSSEYNTCNQSAIPVVGVAVYTHDNAQPQVPVILKLSYTQTEADGATGVDSNIKNLILARDNESGECLPLETQIAPCFASEGQWLRCITAKLNHFSKFQLMIRTAATDLSAVRAYPNPFYTNRGQGFVTMDRLPASAKVRIYTLSGDKVWEGTASTTGVLTWSAVNNSGILVGSGVYLAAIDSVVGKKVLKIAVER